MSEFRISRVAVLVAAAVLWAAAAGCASHVPSAVPGPDAPGPGSGQTFMPQSVTQPTHVTNFTYWKQSGIADSVPASWMALWSTYAEIGTNADAKAFHNAGGKYAVAYTSPNYWYTSSCYTAPGNYPESAFAHTSKGARISRPQGCGTEYYINPNTSGSQSTYQQITDAVHNGGGYNYIYADGVSSNLAISLYHFNGTPVEITTDAEYIGGMKTVLSKSPLPTIANGYMNGNPVQEEEYVAQTNIAAIFGESCFAGHTSISQGQNWIDMANALIYTTTHHEVAICGGRGDYSDNRSQRMYWLGSWWLTYDPTYSVALEIMGSTGNVYLFAEQQLVPTSPLTTATSDISELRTSTGAYAREFEMCYLKGVAFDNCVAVVNPTTSTVSMPSLKHAYHWTLTLDNNNLYYGGLVTWTHSVPSTLAPGTATVLFI
ncbi:MAG: hypothetical protein JO219_11735 [Candidatus Eremiobacteraeota bacterium]|nr:hypothetical protein [Candidatus Eremiobacteraeota bacterium]MBV8366671.1 hypothetical protein [Candidatus Eremiobacteraeota bacterium]